MGFMTKLKAGDKLYGAKAITDIQEYTISKVGSKYYTVENGLLPIKVIIETMQEHVDFGDRSRIFGANRESIVNHFEKEAAWLGLVSFLDRHSIPADVTADQLKSALATLGLTKIVLTFKNGVNDIKPKVEILYMWSDVPRVLYKNYRLHPIVTFASEDGTILGTGKYAQGWKIEGEAVLDALKAFPSVSKQYGV